MILTLSSPVFQIVMATWGDQDAAAVEQCFLGGLRDQNSLSKHSRKSLYYHHQNMLRPCFTTHLSIQIKVVSRVKPWKNLLFSMMKHTLLLRLSLKLQSLTQA